MSGTNATFADFQNTLMQHLPGALPDAVKQTFFTHARRFYKRTRVWRVEIPGLNVTDTSNIIPLNPVDQYSDICFLESALLDKQPLHILADDPAKAWGTTGRPSSIWLDNPHEAHLWPQPPAGFSGTVDLVVSVQPNITADYLPPEALTHHYEGLVSGVLSDMLAQQKKPYTDANLAGVHARRFEVEIIRTASLRDKGYTQRSSIARPNIVRAR